MAIPAMPGAHFIVVQANLLLGHLKACLDRPAHACDTCQRGKAGVCRAEDHVVRHIVRILAVTPDQQPVLPALAVSMNFGPLVLLNSGPPPVVTSAEPG